MENNSEKTGDTPEESSQEIINPQDEPEDKLPVEGEPTSEKKYSKTEVSDMIDRQRKKLVVSNKKEAANTAEESSAKLAVVQHERDLLKIALEQKKQTKPNPEDFEDGEDDPSFIEKKEEHDKAARKEEVSRLVTEQMATVAKTTQETERLNNAASNLENKTTEHYGRVEALNNWDEYKKREDVAITLFSEENVNHLINTFDDSENILWYLGTDANRTEAQNIAVLLRTNPILGMAEIGGIRQKIKLDPQFKAAPDPESEVKGDAPNDGDSRLKKQLEKLRSEAAKGGAQNDMHALIAFRREHPEIN